MLTAITFFFILSVLVLVHELGHFLVARWVGVKVEEFGLGLPPRVVARKIKGVLYSLNLLPIGGFVKLAGEDEVEQSEERINKLSQKGQNVKDFFWARSKLERSIILLAGVTMNFLLAVVITSYLLVQGVPEPSSRVHVEKVLPGSPAEQVGIAVNDVIKSITYSVNEATETKNVKTPRELIEVTRNHLGKMIILTIIRNGQEQTRQIVPRKEYPKGEGPMGVAITDLEVKKYPLPQAPFEAFKINIIRAWEMLASIGSLIWRAVTFQPVGAEVAGPIGIARVTGQAVKFGLTAVLEFMSILSLNLAVLNILPIPALDGGRLAFIFVERLLGKKIRPAFEKSAHQIGMIILLVLILLISLNDILRLTRGG